MKFTSTPLSPELDALIAKARLYEMTPDDYREQRVSFVYGQMNGVLSKDHVREYLRQRGM